MISSTKFIMLATIPFIAGGIFLRGQKEKSVPNQKMANDTTILWKVGTKLTWDDFQGRVDSSSNYKALTYSTVKLTPIIVDENTMQYDIQCSFEKKLSWSKDKKSSILLAHEQLHFDITELVTRKLRQKFLTYKYIDRDAARKMVRRIFDEEEKERLVINRQYDSETAHGTIDKKQKEWETKIAAELKKLDRYASTKVVIKRVKK